MVIPSQAGLMTGRCRDLTADSSARREEKVQTTNPKGASKGVAGKHNLLAVGSNPTGGIPSPFDLTVTQTAVQRNK